MKNEKSLILETNNNIEDYNIKNINNKYEVMKNICNKLHNKYLSNNEQVKVVTNIETGMKIEIWKSGIKETFGNDKYYMNLSNSMKTAKITSMKNLAKLIKYAKVRSKEANNYHNSNSKVKYIYLVSELKIDNDIYTVTIDIRKSPDGTNKFYIHNLSKKKGNNLSQPHCN